MKPIETTTLQVPTTIHKRLKRAALKARSKLMPFTSKIITAGLKVEADQPENEKP